jgi:hypothetical protein
MMEEFGSECIKSSTSMKRSSPKLMMSISWPSSRSDPDSASYQSKLSTAPSEVKLYGRTTSISLPAKCDPESTMPSSKDERRKNKAKFTKRRFLRKAKTQMDTSKTLSSDYLPTFN